MFIFVLFQVAVSMKPVDINEQLVKNLLLKDPDVSTVLALLGEKADPNFLSGDKTPLGLVCENSHNLEIMSMLLEHNADPNLKSSGSFPAMLAVRKNFNFARQAVELLLSHGADINSVGDYGQTVLSFVASQSFGFDFAEFLFSRGAVPDPGALLGAITANHLDLVKLFVNFGLDVNHVTIDEWTYLGRAIFHGSSVSFSIVEFLVNEKADVNLMCTGFTPVSMAVSMDRFNLAKFLVKNGADVNLKNSDGTYPLGLAIANVIPRGISSSQLRFVNFLIENGAELNPQEPVQASPLTLAVRNGRPGLIGILLDHGARPDLQNSDGTTPFHVALNNGDFRVFLRLSRFVYGLPRSVVQHAIALGLISFINRTKRCPPPRGQTHWPAYSRIMLTDRTD